MSLNEANGFAQVAQAVNSGTMNALETYMDVKYLTLIQPIRTVRTKRLADIVKSINNDLILICFESSYVLSKRVFSCIRIRSFKLFYTSVEFCSQSGLGNEDMSGVYFISKTFQPSGNEQRLSVLASTSP